ncbi:hypothetical protein BpHYR1_017724 [Brachionus plicatilis]|uniref:Uncharacterized protein n=1 Tax=Brachionus plicatilis TaxID=10195 RepID=A0A3M7T1F4_BRAPC|nr:hypothetical protein BpHYR1_017724 [Brachionus plicatilis]
MNLKNHCPSKINKIMLYEWMLLNSLLNFMYSLIYSFHLLNECVFNNLSFCPILSRSIPVQYFEIYLIDFHAESILISE